LILKNLEKNGRSEIVTLISEVLSCCT